MGDKPNISLAELRVARDAVRPTASWRFGDLEIAIGTSWVRFSSAKSIFRLRGSEQLLRLAGLLAKAVSQGARLQDKPIQASFPDPGQQRFKITIRHDGERPFLRVADREVVTNYQDLAEMVSTLDLMTGRAGGARFDNELHGLKLGFFNKSLALTVSDLSSHERLVFSPAYGRDISAALLQAAGGVPKERRTVRLQSTDLLEISHGSDETWPEIIWTRSGRKMFHACSSRYRLVLLALEIAVLGGRLEQQQTEWEETRLVRRGR